MPTKYTILLVLLVTASFCEVVKLTDYIKLSKPIINIPLLKLPANCASVDSGNVCKACVTGYQFVNQSCEKTSDDFAPGDSYVPCEGANSCGEAKSFKSSQEFQDFVNKYNPIVPQASIIPPPAPVINIKPNIGLINTIDDVKPVGIQSIKTPRIQKSSIQALSFGGLKSQSGASAPAFSDTASFSSNLMSVSLPSIAPAVIQPAAPVFSIPIAKQLPVVDANRDFSGTNNQQAGVDQADLLKTDGTYIYTISNQVLSIILAYPADKAKLTSKLNFKDFNPSALFIHGDYLAVFGTKYSGSAPYTYIKIYNVANRANPFVLKQFQVAGRYFDGRKLDNGFMYLVTIHDFSSIRVPWFDFGAGRLNVGFSSIFWYPSPYTRPAAVNIISFNLGNPESSSKKVATICAESVNIIYMSERYIYLATSSWQSGQSFTTIRKIFVWGSYIKPFADGKVRGTINNQFSIDEFGSFLRIATTTTSGNTTFNSIFVLSYFMKAYGSLSHIAPGERIFSARYVGLRCYLVTFRQVDPFFVISLRNHRKPQILGQLKVPGFSRYLHPYDENTIVGLGRQADSSGRQLGLKIGLFDVTDPRNPLEAANFEIQQKYASSTAQWQHKAFLLSTDKNLMVIPGSLQQNDTKFNGAFAFYINSTSIELRNVIDHLLNSTDNFYDRNVERSLYIEELLYTKSKCLLRINKINEHFEGVKNVNVPCDIKELTPIIKPRSIIIDQLPPIRPAPILYPRPLPSIILNPIVKPIPIPTPDPSPIINPIPFIDPPKFIQILDPTETNPEQNLSTLQSGDASLLQTAVAGQQNPINYEIKSVKVFDALNLKSNAV